MNVFAAILERVQAAVDALAVEGVLPADLDRARVRVELPSDVEQGGVTTNAALALAKQASRPPRVFADAIVARLRADAFVKQATVSGPGFINITPQPDLWIQALRALLRGELAVTPHQTVAIEDEDIFKFSLFGGFSHVNNQINRGAARFMMLLNGHGSPHHVDLAEAREQCYGNPVFSVQYAHARARAIYGRARDTFQDLPAAPGERSVVLQGAPLALLTDDSECALMRRIAQYPHVMETAAIARKPHCIAAYLNDLAGAFHTHSRHGIATPHLRFIIQNDRQLTVARLALVEAVVMILSAGLALLGVGAPDEIT